MLLWAPAHSEKASGRASWLCFESTIPGYSEPDRRLEFTMIAPEGGCRIAVPVATGEHVDVTADSLTARDELEAVFMSAVQGAAIRPKNVACCSTEEK